MRANPRLAQAVRHNLRLLRKGPGVNGQRIGESCGIFAVFGAQDAAHLAYLALFARQHRGQEPAGIVVSDGRKIRSRKGLGLLGEVVTGDDAAALSGHRAVGPSPEPVEGPLRKGALENQALAP